MIKDMKQAAELYIDAWNKMDFSQFFQALDDDCRYNSQYVFDEMDSKARIVDYFKGKIKTIKKSKSNVIAKLARLKRGASLEPEPGSYCAAVYQDDLETIAAVVFLDVENGKINRINLCMPELYKVELENN
ncbi:MAG: hypothetical protein ACLPX5_15205 [Dissulfurispiraceae bacterium]